MRDRTAGARARAGAASPAPPARPRSARAGRRDKRRGAAGQRGARTARGRGRWGPPSSIRRRHARPPPPRRSQGLEGPEADEERVVAPVPGKLILGSDAGRTLGRGDREHLARAGLPRKREGRVGHARCLGRAALVVDHLEHADAGEVERGPMNVERGRRRRRPGHARHRPHEARREGVARGQARRHDGALQGEWPA